MKAIGLTCGVGSMLVGAKNVGFDVEGNIEWRRYYHHRDEKGLNTFEENFWDTGAFLAKNYDDLIDEIKSQIYGIDLAMGHPECGNYSTLSATVQGKSLEEMNKDAGDIPVFVDLIQKIKPRFFVQDNLPKSLLGYTMEEWAEALPEYDLYPEWISNWGYGNIQKYRNRFFMIGAFKEEKFVFYPSEADHDSNLSDLIHVKEGIENHDMHTLKGSCAKGKGIYHEESLSWGEYKKFMLNADEGATIPYLAKDGTWKKHIGWRKGFRDGYVPVLTGGAPIANPYSGLPFSIRHRARIQGLPDDFVFYGTKYEDDGTWNHSRNSAMIKQTGKCMPVQFCEYVSKQIADHIKNPAERYYTNQRILKPNSIITEAKKWYCDNVGYSNPNACRSCWIKCEKGE